MKKIICLLFLALSLPAFACMNLKGELMINGEPLTIDQKMDHDQTYSFAKGNYIVNVVLPSGQPEGSHLIDIKVDQKKGQKIETVSRGRIIMRDGMEAEMVKKDDKTNETFTYKVVVTNI